MIVTIAILATLLGITVALLSLMVYAYCQASTERDKAQNTVWLVRGMLQAHDHFGQTLQSNQIASILKGMDA